MFEPYVNSLIAVSSFRALDDSAEVAANQLRAKRSWDLVFDRIFYSATTISDWHHPPPSSYRAKTSRTSPLMAWVASQQTVPACILNADIVVAPNLKALVNQAWTKGALAMTSQRLEFDPKTEDYFRAVVRDLGADFFCAMPSCMEAGLQGDPEPVQNRPPTWDQWMLNFLWHTYRRRFR